MIFSMNGMTVMNLSQEPRRQVEDENGREYILYSLYSCKDLLLHEDNLQKFQLTDANETVI